jgi:hypothetical protein
VVLTTTDGSTFGQYTVASQHFTLKLAASDVCWVNVIDSSSTIPVLEGDLQGGQQKAFPADKSISVQVGSAAVVVGIFINGKAVYLNTPANTPYTYTFTSAA